MVEAFSMIAVRCGQVGSESWSRFPTTSAPPTGKLQIFAAALWLNI